MALDELRDNEKTIPVNGLDVLIEDYIRPYLDGYTIDFVNTPYGDGFTISSPDGNGCC
jgi:Fe-S cluster assembly iron-binding protein IscA